MKIFIGASALTVILLIIVALFMWGERWPVEPLSAVQTIKIGAEMPRKIDVMGTVWRVDKVTFPESLGLLGMTDCEKHIVMIDPNGIHPRQTLIHELLHAAVCHYNPKTRDFEPANLWYNSRTNDGHEGFNNIAGVISELLARNPDLAQYEADGDIDLGMVSTR